MRSKTFVLGTVMAGVMLTLMSGREVSADADQGYGKGELLPSIEVGGVRWLSDLKYDDRSIVVFWSSDDPESRAVNAWISHNAPEGQEVYSICTDLNKNDAGLFAELDNVNPRVELIGAVNHDSERQDLRSLMVNAAHTVFFVQEGVIQDRVAVKKMWQKINNSDNQKKKGSVYFDTKTIYAFAN